MTAVTHLALAETEAKLATSLRMGDYQAIQLAFSYVQMLLPLVPAAAAAVAA